MAGWRDEVDRWWAGVLGVPAAAMRAGGVFAAGRFDHVGIVAVAGGAAPVVYGPADTGSALHAMLERAGGTGALEADDLAALLGPRASRVLGPAWYGYATAGSLLAPHGTTVRALTAADLPLLARLHEQTPPEQREESGTTGLPAFGYLEDGALLAVACLGMWQEMPTIGVHTHRARGAGAWLTPLSSRQPAKASPVGLSCSTVPGGLTSPRSLSPPKPASSTTATGSSSTSAPESVSGMSGRCYRIGEGAPPTHHSSLTDSASSRSHTELIDNPHNANSMLGQTRRLRRAP